VKSVIWEGMEYNRSFGTGARTTKKITERA